MLGHLESVPVRPVAWHLVPCLKHGVVVQGITADATSSPASRTTAEEENELVLLESRDRAHVQTLAETKDL